MRAWRRGAARHGTAASAFDRTDRGAWAGGRDHGGGLMSVREAGMAGYGTAVRHATGPIEVPGLAASMTAVA
jgi:hypothetical protein